MSLPALYLESTAITPGRSETQGASLLPELSPQWLLWEQKFYHRQAFLQGEASGHPWTLLL